MIARIVLVLLGSVWGSLCFWLGLWLTFPSELARDRLVYEVDSRSGGGMALRADAVHPWWLTGLSLSGLELYSVENTRRRGGEPPPAKQLLKAATLAARVQLLPLLRGVYAFGVGGDIYGGDLSGAVSLDGKRLTFNEVVLDGLDLSQYPLMGDTYEASLSGDLRLALDLVYDQEEVKASEGRVRLKINDLRINSAKVMGFDLPEAVFTEALLSFKVENGRAEVRHGTFVSDTLSAEVDGQITLNESFGRSRLNLTIDVKLGDELDTLAKLAPGVKDARDDDGVYHFNCLGTVERPSCRPKSSRRTPPARGATRGASTLGSPLDGGVDEGDDLARRLPGGELDNPDDDVARRREERLAERRDRIRKRREERLAAQDEREIGGPGAGDDIELQDDEEFIDEEPEFIDEEFEPEFEDELPAAGDPGFEDGPVGEPGDLDELGYIDE
ncbi:MAG: type II secretion system protein GspN [Alphaproteobacteria bacterium]|nr:type II secretion system protein GspN [Alphaproteobacteria bacterium]